LSDLDYSTVTPGELVDVLSRLHLDISRRSGVYRIDRSILRSGLQLWLSPRNLANTSGWRDKLACLLSDRQTARAIRYAALRILDEMRAVGKDEGS
jgi:hypothetical protein